MWADESKAWLFWKREPYNTIKDILVIRRQLSGLCYMHAPTVMQHYKVAGFTRASDHRMIDVASFVRNNMRGRALEHHLVNDGGGSSVQFLQNITNVEFPETMGIKLPRLPKQLCHQNATAVAECLQMHGPGLVAGFRVDAAFGTTDKTSFLREVINKNILGLHAMIVIGYRQEDNGDYVFLLQNWWHNRYLIEVSESYLAQSDATCVFITTDLQRIPANLPTVDTPYAETEADTGERWPLEMV